MYEYIVKEPITLDKIVNVFYENVDKTNEVLEFNPHIKSYILEIGTIVKLPILKKDSIKEVKRLWD